MRYCKQRNITWAHGLNPRGRSESNVSTVPSLESAVISSATSVSQGPCKTRRNHKRHSRYEIIKDNNVTK